MTKNIPIIPGTGLSYNTAIDTNSGENIFKKRVRAENMEQDEKTSKQSQALAAPFLEALGIEGVNTPLDNYNSGVLLDAAEKKGNEFITKAQEISNNRKITFQDPIWRNAFSKWLDVQFKNPPRNNLFSGCKWEGNSSDEKLENLFKDERARKIYENNFKTIKSTSNRNELKSEKAFQKTN